MPRIALTTWGAMELTPTMVSEVQTLTESTDSLTSFLLFPGLYFLDNPLPIGFAATISAPHMHASATEDLLPSIPVEGAHILDVGSGSGYLTAVLARIAGPTGRVVGIDYLDGLTEMAENNVRRDDASLLESGRVRFATRDGWEGFKVSATMKRYFSSQESPPSPPGLYRSVCLPLSPSP